MRAKLISVFLLSFALFIGLLIWRVDVLIFGDKLAWSEAQTRSQMAPLVHGLESDFTRLSENLQLAIPQLEDKKDFALGSPLARFQMIAQLKNNSGKDWSISKVNYLEKTSAKAWANQYMNLLLKNIDGKEIKTGTFAVYSLLDPQRNTFIFALTRNHLGWYGVLVGSEFFQNLIDRQKGQISTVSLVNEKGQALGHTIPEYVGNSLVEDPLVSQMIQSGAPNGSGVFQNLRSEKVQGFFEQVPRTNIYAVITTPLSELLKNRTQTWMQIALMGLGLAFVGMALFVYFYKPEKELVSISGVESTQPVSFSINPAALAVNSGLPGEEPFKEKMQAFTQLATAMSHELKAPIASILGYAQLLKSSFGDNEYTQGIEENARRARELMQKLVTFSGQEKPKIENVKLSDLVLKVLRNNEPKFFRKGVQVNQMITITSETKLPADLIIKALDNIFQNAIDAMDRNPKKELIVDLHEEGEKIHLSITDSGEGIDSANMTRILEPFYTTRSAKSHVGLGLPMTLGILQSIKATMSIDSEKQKGTVVKIEFDPAAQWEVSTTENQIAARFSEMAQVASPQLKAPVAPAPGAIAASAAVGAIPSLTPPEKKDVDPELIELVNLEDFEVQKVLDDDQFDLYSAEEDEFVTGKVSTPIEPANRKNNVVQGLTLPIEEKIGPKPKIDLPKKEDRLKNIEFQIRRPGGRA